MKDYEESMDGLRKFLNDVHGELKEKYRTVDIPFFIDTVITKLEEMTKKGDEKTWNSITPKKSN